MNEKELEVGSFYRLKRALGILVKIVQKDESKRRVDVEFCNLHGGKTWQKNMLIVTVVSLIFPDRLSLKKIKSLREKFPTDHVRDFLELAGFEKVQK